MAAPAGSNNGNPNGDFLGLGHICPFVAVVPGYRIYLSSELYIKDQTELQLFARFIVDPRNADLHVANYLECIYSNFPGGVPVLSERRKAKLWATISAEQIWRFTRVAEWYDIRHAQVKLEAFKEHMQEIEGVLEAYLEDEMADFDPEEFKRMEKVCRK